MDAAAQPPSNTVLPGQEERERIEAVLQSATTQFELSIAEVDLHYAESEAFAVFKTEHEKLYALLTSTVKSSVAEFEAFRMLHTTYNDNVETAKVLALNTAGGDASIRALQTAIRKTADTLASTQAREEAVRNDARRAAMAAAAAMSGTSGLNLTAEQERVLADLAAAKSAALKELEASSARGDALSRRLTERIGTQGCVGSLTVVREQAELASRTLAQMRESTSKAIADGEREAKKRESLDAEIRLLRESISLHQNNAKSLNDSITRVNGEIAAIQSKIKMDHNKHGVAQADLAAVKQKCLQLKETRVDLHNELRAAQSAQSAAAAARQAAESAAARGAEQAERMMQSCQGASLKVRQIQAKKDSTEATIQHLKSGIANYEQENTRLVQQVDETRRTIDQLTREIALLTHKARRVEGHQAESVDLGRVLTQTLENLEQEVQQARRDAANRRHASGKQQQDLQRITQETKAVQQSAKELQQKVRHREYEIYQHKRQSIDAENRLKHSLNLQESAIAERNLQIRTNIDVQAEVNELRRNLKTIAFQISGRKEETQAKEEALARELADSERLDRETEALEDEIQGLRERNERAQAYHRSQVTTSSRLAQHVKEAECEQHKQAQALHVAIAERDHQSAQLIRQDSELRAAYADIKSVQYELLRGEKHYLAQEAGLSNITEEIRSLMQQLKTAHAKVHGHDELKRTLHQLTSEQQQAQQRKSVLEQSLEQKVNIHRWRVLQSADTAAFQVIEEANALRRELLNAGNKNAQCLATIEELETKYLKLAEQSKKAQTVPEHNEKTQRVAVDLSTKNRILKQLDLYRAQIREGRYVLATLARQKDELCIEYASQKACMPK